MKAIIIKFYPYTLVFKYLRNKVKSVIRQFHVINGMFNLKCKQYNDLQKFAYALDEENQILKNYNLNSRQRRRNLIFLKNRKGV